MTKVKEEVSSLKDVKVKEDINMPYDPMTKWHQLTTDPNELNLSLTLLTGQAFRWIQTTEGYTSTLHSLFVTLKQDSVVYFQLHNAVLSVKEARIQLVDYFQLDIKLMPLWNKWKADPNFATRSIGFEGLRVLRQDTFETLLCFICSSNNNIKRITQMVHAFTLRYGNFVGTVEGIEFYAFPTIDQITGEVEIELRDLGFGYRAKYIAKTIDALNTKEPEFLNSLRETEYDLTRIELLQFCGVGPKVADCVALFSMDKTDIVPVDTHVWQIALRDYDVNVKTLNKTTYEKIGDTFKGVFGQYAGWAHSVLFSEDLLVPRSKKRKVEE